MILHENDSEFYKGVADDQNRRTHAQGCHILKALLILEQCCVDGIDMNWR